MLGCACRFAEEGKAAARTRWWALLGSRAVEEENGSVSGRWRCRGRGPCLRWGS